MREITSYWHRKGSILGGVYHCTDKAIRVNLSQRDEIYNNAKDLNMNLAVSMEKLERSSHPVPINYLGQCSSYAKLYKHQ